ncbi:MAG: 16S rRNA (guanine(966)-N(2))-methyltransferase RsmD [Sporolactobacillus sp.]
MRVIAGANKGRRLMAAGGRMTRPTTDRVKETIFNLIGPFFDGGAVLDLYAGSGALAIEALSRGAEHAVLVDRSSAACHAIRTNLALCGYQERAQLHCLTAVRALDMIVRHKQQFDYIFLDPPYAQQQISRDMEWLLTHDLLRPRAMVVAEHDESQALPSTFGDTLVRIKYRTYQGQTAISVYRLANAPRGGKRE